MNILVLGANGMAGHMIVRYLKQSSSYNVFTLARDNADYCVDVEQERNLKAVLAGQDFDFVINCIGVLVKPSEDNPGRAAYINGLFPHYLEHCFEGTKTRVIHLSTDCVFDGAKGNYTESEFPTETNMYGLTKALGELHNTKDVTFRMSIIGPELKNGTSFFSWITNNPNTELPGWDNAQWNGITTLQLAKCIKWYIENADFTGIYHLVSNENQVNKYDLAVLINQVFALGKTIVRTQGPKTFNKVLVDTRNLMGLQIPNYQTQLEELKNF